MDTQHKILFLKSLLETSIERLNISPLHVYKSKIDVSGGNLSVEITYNGKVTYSKKYENLTVTQTYVNISKIVETIIASEIVSKSVETDKGSIKTIIGRI